jgi:cation transport regulator ChaB
VPKTNKSGNPIADELPSTLQRSGRKAQETFAKTYDSAIEQYDGDERRAHQVAFASLKHTHEKVGDHWEPKEEYGPSDERAARSTPDSGDPGGSTAAGVDANASKKHLMEVAKRLDVKAPTRRTKDELVEEIRKANDRATRRARED